MTQQDNQPGQAELLALMRRRGEWWATKMAESFKAASGFGSATATGKWITAAAAANDTAITLMRSAGFPQFAIDEYQKTCVAKFQELMAAEIGRELMIRLFRESGFTVGTA